MALWFILALMTALALAAVFWPFVVGAEPVPGGGEVAVYKDQLSEIDRDLQAGLIGSREAGAARIEVSRRLLQAADDTTRYAVPLAGEHSSTRKLALLAIATAFLPVLAGSLYLHLGSPTAVSILSATYPSETDSRAALVESMVNQVEGYLKEAPGDGRGWETLAPIYMRMGRYDDAIRAWQNAIANLGDDVEREENLGGSLVAAANGVVTKEARDAFDRARSMDPNDITARFYAGLAAKQDGRPDEAARLWRDLIAEAPPDAEWADTVRDALARLDEPPSTAGEAQSLGEDQIAMIKNMVDSLAERLKADGRDTDGWIRLVQSYNVLGDRAKAEAAVADARKALAADPGKLARFEAGSAAGDRPAAGEPKGQDVARAVPPEHQNATVRAMVDRLAERLGKDGGDPDRWFMLIRSYETLGEQKEVQAATARARAAFASDPEKLSYLNQLLRNPDDAASNVSTLNKSPLAAVAGAPSAAETVAAEGQMTMIRGMVDRLAERLKQNGRDVDGWMQLIRSYVVLGQRDQAVAAAASARVALGGDADAIRRVAAAAKELGIALP
jgi:cytochrome c-type biogenesis protein CcmH